MTTKVNSEDIEEAREALEQIQEAMNVLDHFFCRRVGGITEKRWEMYPKGHILMHLSNDHSYLGQGTFTVEGLLESVEASLDEDDEPEVAKVEGCTICDNEGAHDVKERPHVMEGTE